MTYSSRSLRSFLGVDFLVRGLVAGGLLASGLLSGGCISHEAVDLTGKQCPCAEGWMCDSDTNTCTRGGPVLTFDAGRGDTDSGPGRDGGVVDMDGGSDDAGQMMMSNRVSIEAESETPSAPMETIANGDASGGMAVGVPEAMRAINADPASTMGRVSYEFSIGEAGMYKVWGRVIAPDESADSFWVTVDDGAAAQWNNLSIRTAWEWVEVHDSASGTPVVQTYELAPGTHTLTITYREDGASLDKIIIAPEADPAPTGLGD